MNRLTNKVAVITGGNSGIGYATAQAFAREGAHVVISGRNAQTLAEATQSIGGDTLGVQGDISNLSDIDTLMGRAHKTFGKIDVLVVNAGVFKGATLAEFTEELYDELADVNLKGTFFTVQKALPYLNRGASVILVSSAVNDLGMPTASIYAATKAAVRSLARTLSSELVDQGIRVNAMSPGPVETPIFGRLNLSEQSEANMRTGLTENTPIGRMGRPDEIANTMVFLASDDSSFMLGAELVADGGMKNL